MENIASIIESLIFASEAPLALEKICAVLEDVGKNEIKDAIERLIREYDERESGICIQEVAGGYQYRTRPELAAWIKKLKGVKPATLSPAALETLAIVAYRQPIVKAEIESIRGVDVSAPLKGLMEKKLIRMVGRKDVPGKPIIYGTTKKFLEVFNLKELTDLPTMRELKEITEHQEVYEQETIDFESSQQGAQEAENAEYARDHQQEEEPAGLPGDQAQMPNPERCESQDYSQEQGNEPDGPQTTEVIDEKNAEKGQTAEMMDLPEDDTVS